MSINMVRPKSLSNPIARRRRFAQALSIQQTGARLIGKTKGGQPLYQLGGAVFKARDLEVGRERYAHVNFGLSKSKSRKLAGL